MIKQQLIEEKYHNFFIFILQDFLKSTIFLGIILFFQINHALFYLSRIQVDLINYNFNQSIQRKTKMFNEKIEEGSKPSAFRKLSIQSIDPIIAEQNIGVANQMLQVINAQNSLIMKLLQRQNLLYQELNKRLSSSDSGSRSPNEENQNKEQDQRIENNQNGSYSYHFSDSSNGSKQKFTNRAQIKIIQSIGNENYKLEEDKIYDENNENNDNQNNNNQDFVFLKDQVELNKYEKKQTQTKNMIKNYAKGIFNFIRKNRDKRMIVLNSLSIKEEQFMKEFFQLKGKIHSLSQLRSIWIPNGNIFNKAFRILSSLYLRKYCLQKTFNSRIENYGVHMKYRNRLREGIANPVEFTILKTN